MGLFTRRVPWNACQGLLSAILAKVDTMSQQLDELNTKVDALTGKITTLEAGYDQVADALKALQAAGGASSEDLSGVIAKIDAITSGVDADIARNAAAPTPPASSAPTA